MTPGKEHIGGEEKRGGSEGAKRTSILRRITRMLVAIPIALVVLAVCLLLALEIDPVVNATAQWALDRFDPLQGASMSAQEVRGGLLSGLIVDEFSITSDDDRVMVHVPAASASIRLLPLMRSQVSLEHIRIREPVVRMRQLADSTWDLFNAFPTDTTEVPSSTIVSIDDLSLTDGEAEMTFQSRDPDSTMEAWALNLSVSDFRTGDGFRVDLDSLSARFRPAGASDTVSAFLRFRLEDRRLDLHRLDLRSALSDVSGSGSIVFPGDQEVDSVDFRVQASPLSFRDIQLFLPGLNPDAEVRLDVHAAGDGRSIEAQLSAGFGDGSTLSAEGSFSPPGADVLSMSLDATADRLSTSYLFGSGNSSPSVLTGSITGQVTGPSADSLNGDVRLRMDPFDFARYDIDILEGSARFTDGRATFSLASVVNGSNLRLTGNARPFDDVPAYNGELRFQNLDPSRLSGLSQPASLQGSLKVDGTGFSPEAATASVILDLDRSHWNQVPLREGRLNAVLAASRVDADLRLAVADGTVSARGRLNRGERPTYSVQSMDLAAVPVAELRGDTLRSSISGRLSGSGSGLDLSTMELQASVELSDSYYGDTEIQSSQADIAMQRGAVEVSGNAQVRGGFATFDVTGRPFSSTPRYEIGELSFRSVDVAELTRKSAWVTDLTGRLTGEVRIADGESSGSLSVVLDTSRVNEQTITSARLDGTLADGRLAGIFD
ncbi:MAG: hypothetical protein KJO98_16565, partial [Rhodothermia bacterium]|nr:hypothetical protein [Rhodothermia bacterium]